MHLFIHAWINSYLQYIRKLGYQLVTKNKINNNNNTNLLLLSQHLMHSPAYQKLNKGSLCSGLSNFGITAFFRNYMFISFHIYQSRLIQNKNVLSIYNGKIMCQTQATLCSHLFKLARVCFGEGEAFQVFLIVSFQFTCTLSI